MWKLTVKQKALADWIYETTGYKWQGGNPEDFTKYVNTYKPLAEQESYNRQLQHGAELDCIDSRRNW